MRQGHTKTEGFFILFYFILFYFFKPCFGLFPSILSQSCGAEHCASLAASHPASTSSETCGHSSSWIKRKYSLNGSFLIMCNYMNYCSSTQPTIFFFFILSPFFWKISPILRPYLQKTRPLTASEAVAVARRMESAHSQTLNLKDGFRTISTLPSIGAGRTFVTSASVKKTGLFA